jgi:hypothetical protein
VPLFAAALASLEAVGGQGSIEARASSGPVAGADVRQCLRMSGNVCECPAMFADVRQCLRMSGNVCECPAMFANVRQCLKKPNKENKEVGKYDLICEG